MAITKKSILIRLYIIAMGLFIFAVALVVRLVEMQVVDGDKYRNMAMKRTEKDVYHSSK